MGKTTGKININNVSASLVSLVALGAFVLSYSNLHGMAIDYGIPPRLAWIWPLLIDFALIVFSLAVVRASSHGESTRWPWLMVALYTVGTIGFNVYHAADELPAQVVAVVAPISLFLTFETLMGMLRSGVKRAGVVQSITEIEAESQKKRLELAELETRTLSEIGEKATLKQAEVDALVTQQATLQTDLDKASQKLSDITRQVEEKRHELNTTQDATLVNVWDLVGHIDPAHLDTTQRQFFVAILANAGVTQKDIAGWANVTVKTVQRDIQGCNGLIKKAA